MKTQRLVVSLALSLAVTSLTSAQSVHVFEGEEHFTSWPAGLGGSGAFGRGVPAHLTQGQLPDAVLLRGTTPVLLVRPDQFFAPTAIPVTANDLDTLRGAGPGGLDALVFIGPAGVTLGWFDTVEHEFATELATDESQGGLLVRAADLDGDDAVDFVVVEADGTTVTPYLAQPGGGFTAGASFTTLAPTLDLVPLRWDADAGLEFALLTTFGVELFDDDGSPETSWAAALPGGALCAFSEQASSVDRLLWITAWAPPAKQFLMTLSPGGVDDIVNLGSLDAFAAVATDYDLDGFDDILVSHKYSQDLLWFENLRSGSNPTGASFSAQNTDMIAFRVGPDASSAPENEAWPIVSDFDGDGDDDIVFANGETLELGVLRGETIDQAAMLPGVLSAAYKIDATSQVGVLEVQFDAPVSIPGAATALELEVWRQLDLALPMESTSVEHLMIELPASWPLTVSVPLPESDAQFTSCYYLQVRLVEQDATGAPKDSFPTQVLAFSRVAADVAVLEFDPTTTGTVTVPEPEPDAVDWGGTMTKQGRTAGMPPGEAPKSALVMF